MFPDLTVPQWIVLVCSVLTVGVVIGTIALSIDTWRTCRQIDRIVDQTRRVTAETRRLTDRTRSDA